MPKLRKIRSERQLWKFCSDISGSVIVEKKIDGISCTLFYSKGQFVKAVSKRGWNITKAVKRISSIPKQVDTTFTGGIRGELYMTKRGLELCNEERKAKGLRIYKTPISATLGSMRSNESLHQKGIEFHGFFLNGWVWLETQLDAIRKLERLGINRQKEGFHTVFKLPRGFHALRHYVLNRQARRDEFDSNIDGLVIKANLLALQKTKKKIVAFKYDSISTRRTSKQSIPTHNNTRQEHYPQREMIARDPRKRPYGKENHQLHEIERLKRDIGSLKATLSRLRRNEQLLLTQIQEQKNQIEKLLNDALEPNEPKEPYDETNDSSLEKWDELMKKFQDEDW